MRPRYLLFYAFAAKISMASEGANLGHAIACIAIAAYLRNRSIKSAVFVGNLSDGYQVDLKYTIRE